MGGRVQPDNKTPLPPPTVVSGAVKSLELYEKAGQCVAGRTHLFGRRAEMYAFGISPIYSDRQSGGRFWDVDGREYLDFNLGAGAVLLGHAYPTIVEAVQKQAAKGTGLTINHPLEIEVAEQMVETVPCAEMVRFCKGGGEANLIAIRIARAATGREKVVFCGYHGWHDWYLAANLNVDEHTLDKHLLPGIVPLGVPGVLEGTTLSFEYNNLESLRSILESHRGEIACIIMEAARTYLPELGFLDGVRALANQHNVILIFDEVVTGFRTSRGGAQEYFGVRPDMATFAKCISNGFALGAVAGRREIMEVTAESFISSVYWAEATGLAAGLATLNEYARWDVAGAINQVGKRFQSGCQRQIEQTGVPLKIVGLPSMPAITFQGVDRELIDPLVTLYMQETALRGVFGGPVFYFCVDHSDNEITQALATLGEVMVILRKALDDGNVQRFLRCPVRQSGFRRLV